jgi:formamidopyrimidine-DNA glycosylase
VIALQAGIGTPPEWRSICPKEGGLMPELPDLAVVEEYLQHNIVGQTVVGAEMTRPTVLRELTGEGLTEALAGRRFTGVRRRGKFLILTLDEGARYLVVNPMLAGRLQHVRPQVKRRKRTYLVLSLSDGRELRYTDARSMGKCYVTDNADSVPGLRELGPDALDADLTLEVFLQRMRRHRGQIKGTLCRQSFVAGIGNAYADEILFRAHIYPFRRSAGLSEEERARIYWALREVLTEAVEVVRERVGDDIGREEEVRDFLQVHRKGGEPCPVCGTPISEITAQRRVTNFCRRCQPGTLVGI